MYIPENRTVEYWNIRALEKIKKSIGILTIICLVALQAVSAYYDDNNPSYRTASYNNQPYTTYTSPLYAKLDLFHTTTHHDFLYSPVFALQRTVLEKNGTFDNFCATKLAKDINPSDFSGCSIENGKQWSSFSSLIYGYDAVTFSKVKYNDDKVVSCLMTTQRGGDVQDAMIKAQYNAKGLPTTFTITSYGPRDIAVMPQTVHSIAYTPSQDQNRYTTELMINRIKAVDPETYGFSMNVAALESGGCEPPHYVAQSFGIRTEGTDIRFSNVTWSRDIVTGFDARIKDNAGSITEMHVTSVLDNEFKISRLDIDITRNGATEHTTWTRESDVPLQKVVDDMNFGANQSQNQNPLKILGSSTMQLGDAKVVFLAHSFDEVAHAENSRGNFIEQSFDAVKTWFTKAVDWVKKLFGKEVHATVQVSDTTQCKVDITSNAGNDIAQRADKAVTVWDKVKTWVSDVFSSGYRVKTSEVSVKNVDAMVDTVMNKAGKYVRESKEIGVGIVDMTRQGIFSGVDAIRQGAIGIGNNVSSVATNASAASNQNMLMTALYMYVNVQQAIATYKAIHTQFDGEKVMMMENVATLTDMQEVKENFKNIEGRMQSALSFYTPENNLRVNGRDNYQSQNMHMNLVNTHLGITSPNLEIMANTNVNLGVNGMMCLVSATVQYAVSTHNKIHIGYENCLEQGTKQWRGILNYNIEDTATVSFEVDTNWLLFRLNLKY